MGNDDRGCIIGAGTKAALIEKLESFRSRIGLELTETLMHVLPIRESTLQGESNHRCSYKARRRVDNDSVKNKFWTAYITLMSCFKVSLDGHEELDNRHFVLVWMHVGIFLQEPVFEGVRMKRITRVRIAWFELFSFIDLHFRSKENRPGPMISVLIIPTFDGRHEVLQRSQASNEIEGEKVGVTLSSRRQACNPSDLLIEVVVVDLSSGGLIGTRQLNQVNWPTWGNDIVGVGPTG